MAVWYTYDINLILCKTKNSHTTNSFALFGTEIGAMLITAVRDMTAEGNKSIEQRLKCCESAIIAISKHCVAEMATKEEKIVQVSHAQLTKHNILI